MFCTIFLSLFGTVNVQAATTAGSVSTSGSFITETVSSGLSTSGSVSYSFDISRTVGLNTQLQTDKYYILNFHLVTTPKRHLSGGPGAASINAVPYVIHNGVKYYIGTWYGLLVKGSSSNNISLGYEISGNVYSNSTSARALFFAEVEYSLDVTILELSANEVADSVIQNDINNSIKQGNQLQQEANQTGKGILGKITEFFGSFFENIINALKSLFIPEDGYFSDFFTRLNDFFSEKLGFLYEPIELFLDFLNAIQNASVGASPGLTFPEIKWEDDVIVPETRVDFAIVQEKMPDLQEKIYFVTDIIMVGAVLILLEKKINEVMHR